MSRVVLYAEVPCFYAELERADDGSLRARPVIVGGDPRRRGLVQDATPDARAAGVREDMLVEEALQRCPHARAVRTRMPRYREAAQRLRACLLRHVEQIEPDGLGAAYLDPSSSEEAPPALAARLRAAVREELGLPLRVGGAGTRVAARLACEEAGEPGVRVLAAGDERGFLASLALTRLPGVGPTTATRLAELGAARVGDLVEIGRARLEAALGNRGLELLAIATGQGTAEVRGERHPRSISQETTLLEPARDLTALEQTVAELAARIESTLRVHRLGARRLTLKLRYVDGELSTRTHTGVRALASAAEIEREALALLARSAAGERAVRLLGLAASFLARTRRDDRQLDLFGAGQGGAD